MEFTPQILTVPPHPSFVFRVSGLSFNAHLARAIACTPPCLHHCSSPRRTRNQVHCRNKHHPVSQSSGANNGCWARALTCQIFLPIHNLTQMGVFLTSSTSRAAPVDVATSLENSCHNFSSFSLAHAATIHTFVSPNLMHVNYIRLH